MANNCNKFDVKFDSCEEVKTVNFKIDTKDMENTSFNKKIKFDNTIRSSSSSSKKVIIFIVMIALVARSCNCNFNYKFNNCDLI